MHLCQWLSSPENANSSKMYIRFYPAYIICNFTVRFRHFNSQSDERSLSSAAGYSSLTHCSAKQQRHTRQTQTCKWNTLKSMFLSLCFLFFYSFKWQLQNSSALFGTFVGVSECSRECHAKITYVSVKGILSLYSKLMKSARLNIPCMKMAYFQNQSFCISRTWCWNLKPILWKVVKKCRWKLVLCHLHSVEHC